MESADLLRVASDSWRLFFHWTGEYWPALCLPALLAVLAWVAAYWNYLLARPFGRYWPVPAALLPALIPLARSLEENASTGVQTFTVVVLLLAVAVLQLYGQERNNRDRLETAAQAEREERHRRRERVETERRILQQRNLLVALLSQLRQQTADISRLADAVADLALEEEEEEN